MYRPGLAGFHGSQVIQGRTGNVEKASQGFRPHGHHNPLSGVIHRNAPRQTIGGSQGETSDPVIANVLLDFQHQFFTAIVQVQGVKQLGQLVGGKLHVDNGADYLRYFSGGHRFLPCGCLESWVSWDSCMGGGRSRFGRSAFRGYLASDQIEKLVGDAVLAQLVHNQG